MTSQSKLYQGDIISVDGEKTNFIVVAYRNKGAQSDDGPSIEFDCVEFNNDLSKNFGFRVMTLTNPSTKTFHIEERGMTGRGKGIPKFECVKVVGKSKVSTTVETRVVIKDWTDSF